MRSVLLVALVVAAGANNVCPPFPSACVIDIPAATTLAVGECILPGASCRGDTFITLYNKIGQMLIENDDGFNGAACGYCSYLQYTNADASNAVMTTLNQTCFAGSACSGTTVYTFTPVTSRSGSQSSESQPPPAAAGLGQGQVSQTVTIQQPQSSVVLLVCAVVVTTALVAGLVVFTILSVSKR